MSETSTIRTASCSGYERLLEECKSALLAWKTKREEFIRCGPRSRGAGDELQRLQAEYARAYNRLERHAKNCQLCHFHTETEKEDQRGPVIVATRKQLSA